VNVLKCRKEVYTEYLTLPNLVRNRVDLLVRKIVTDCRLFSIEKLEAVLPKNCCFTVVLEEGENVPDDLLPVEACTFCRHHVSPIPFGDGGETGVFQSEGVGEEDEVRLQVLLSGPKPDEVLNVAALPVRTS
jgi:hypothetical protein